MPQNVCNAMEKKCATKSATADKFAKKCLAGKNVTSVSYPYLPKVSNFFL